MTKTQRIYRLIRSTTKVSKADAREFAVKLARMSVAEAEAIRQ